MRPFLCPPNYTKLISPNWIPNSPAQTVRLSTNWHKAAQIAHTVQCGIWIADRDQSGANAEPLQSASASRERQTERNTFWAAYTRATLRLSWIESEREKEKNSLSKLEEETRIGSTQIFGLNCSSAELWRPFKDKEGREFVFASINQ